MSVCVYMMCPLGVCEVSSSVHEVSEVFFSILRCLGGIFEYTLGVVRCL